MADADIRGLWKEGLSRGDGRPREYCPICEHVQEALLIQGKVYCARCRALLATCCEGI